MGTDPDRPLLSDRLVRRTIAGETLLIPVRREAVELNSFFRVNQTAAFILDQIDGTRTVEDIAALVRDEFDGDEETTIHDTRTLVKDLRELGFLQTAEV